MSLGYKFEKEREDRASKAAETLKYIMKENISAQTCCEGWDDAIKLVRDLLNELHLKPSGIRIEHLTMKDMVKLLRQAFKAKQ